MTSRTVAGAESAFHQMIEADPWSVIGHVGKARCRLRAGDRDAAVLLLSRAERVAEFGRLSDDEQREWREGERMLSELRTRIDAERADLLAQRGLPHARWSPRLAHALDLAAGRRRLYPQQPTAFHYPGLPTVQFFDPAEFDWTAGIEAAADVIREELVRELTGGREDFRAYIQNDSSSGPLGGNQALVNNADWSVLALCENGWIAPEIIQRFPRTWDAILRAPLPRVAGWGPTVVFSLLKAGARIAPHTGVANTRLICHLPLIVPTGCRFRVGDEVREWREGRLMIFDDSIEHEAWNDGADDRVVLIFDIWRPELTAAERRELTALFSD